MGVQPPFLYDKVRSEGSGNVPYKEFDPRAATRASFQSSRVPPRPKQEGPLVSFNQHPDSYLILPYGNTSAKPMSPYVKKAIKWTRIVQLVLRCLEILCAGGLLAFMILIRNVDDVTGWIMRIVPGVAILHTVYGIYHLGRKASGRTPASSASYMLFASFFDCSILPFYAFSALVARTRQSGWTTVFDNGDGTTINIVDVTRVDLFSNIVFILATIGGGLHLVSLAISLYLAITFRKITKLPPDMNPLEDNLTSRHKRSKSSISTVTTASSKRLSTPLEAKRSSGAPYEDLSRPPTIPFFHTRTQSTDSFTTYKSTRPPSSRAVNGRSDLPSYQSVPNPASARNSMIDLKRSSGYAPSTPPKRASYQEVPVSDEMSIHSSTVPRPTTGKMNEGWYANDSLGKARTRSRTPSPKKSSYKPVSQHTRHDSTDDISFHSAFTHPNPLSSNPSTPTPPKHSHKYNLSRDSPLSEISRNSRHLSNQTSKSIPQSHARADSNDIADQSSQFRSSHNTHNPYAYHSDSDVDSDHDADNDIAAELQLERELTPAPLSSIGFKAKRYGELKPGTPPIMVGKIVPGLSVVDRQISSGNDYGYVYGNGKKREVSGKVAEEGRGFGTRFRKVSGL